MTIYFQRDAAALPHRVGVDQADGSRSSDGNPGHICFGPFLGMAPGTYFGGFRIRRLAPSAHREALRIDAVSKEATVAIADRSVAGTELLEGVAGLVGMSFDLDAAHESFELRLFVAEGVMVNVKDVVVFRTQHLRD